MSDLTEKLYETPLDSGELVWIKPLSPLTYQALLNEARRLFPEPNPAEYQRPLQNAFVEGLLEPPEQNPDYVEALRKARVDQINWIYEAVIRLGVVVDTPEGKEATIARYAAQLAAVRKYTKVEEDDWLATVLYCLISTRQDNQVIVEVAREVLTREEIRNAVRSFRRPVQRSRSAAHHRKPGAPRVERRARETAEAEDQLQRAPG